MLTLRARAPRIRKGPCLRVTPQTQSASAARRTFRSTSDKQTPFFSSQPGHRTTSSASGRLGLNLFRSYTSYGPSGPAYRSAKSVAWALIGLNTAVFATWQCAKATRDTKLIRFMDNNFLLSTDSIKAGRYHTLLTSAFSHRDIGHFVFNMIALFTFGNLLAISGVGRFHVLAAGLGSALVGSLASLYHQWPRQAPQKRDVWGAFGGGRTRVLMQNLGASGLVMGLGATATCLMPFAPMRLIFMPLIPIPLFVLTLVYFGVDAFFLDRGQTGIGHAAHMGGTVFGAIYYFTYLGKYGGVWPMLRRAIMRR